MSVGFWQLLLILLIILILFGKGRVSDVMKDLGKGIKSFKEGLKDNENSNKEDKK